jgi:nifR3 family TIM-barrel protein
MPTSQPSMSNIFETLPRPIISLAPMADVTDSAFRQIIAKYGKPDLFYTEFTSCDGLQSAGRERLLRELYFTKGERPIMAQIFGSRAENFYKTAQLVKELGFDGVDINMGCPESNVNKQGACADLIRNPELAKEIIQATKDGAGGLPVTVKTRIGYNTVDLESWTSELLEAKPVAITFHWRTKKEMSKVPAHWELASIPVAMAKGTGVFIFGNGDVSSVADAREKAATYGLDGVMLGRAIFGNPWLFSDKENNPESVEGPLSLEEKLSVMLEHTRLYWDLYGPTATNKKLFGGHTKNFAIMKKHYSAYAKGFDGASELRQALMTAENPDQVEQIVNNFLSKN